MEERTTSGCSGHSSIPSGTTTCNLTCLIQEWGEGGLQGAETVDFSLGRLPGSRVGGQARAD